MFAALGDEVFGGGVFAAVRRGETSSGGLGGSMARGGVGEGFCSRCSWLMPMARICSGVWLSSSPLDNMRA